MTYWYTLYEENITQAMEDIVILWHKNNPSAFRMPCQWVFPFSQQEKQNFSSPINRLLHSPVQRIRFPVQSYIRFSEWRYTRQPSLFPLRTFICQRMGYFLLFKFLAIFLDRRKVHLGHLTRMELIINHHVDITLFFPRFFGYTMQHCFVKFFTIF